MTATDIRNTLDSLKKDIPQQAEWEDMEGFLESAEPFLDVTFATTTGTSWGVQTGDILFSGEARKFQKRHTVRLFTYSHTDRLATEAHKALS